MAQVTMDSKEYLEMVEKIRHLEQVEKDMLNNVEVELNLEPPARSALGSDSASGQSSIAKLS